MSHISHSGSARAERQAAVGAGNDARSGNGRAWHQVSRWIGAVLILLWGSTQAFGQPAVTSGVRIPEAVRSLRSHSGQFIVSLAPKAVVTRSPSLATNTWLVRLEPSLLTVSCERIKTLLSRELRATAPWEGKVFVVLFPAVTENDPITITCQRLRDGWEYRLDLPDRIDPPRLIRTVVHLLLLEMANRTAPERSAEIPLWLAEGLTRHLQVTSEPEIVLRAPSLGARGITVSTSAVDAQMGHPLENAHKILRAHPPLTFEQLSWATPNMLSGEQGEVYAASAQLFVQELLSLKDGPACLRAMISELARHYNWQLAFLRGFHQHFGRPLDTEKWWALRIVHFTGRELEQTWSLPESWEKLDQALHAPVQLRTGPNELPLSAEVSLQTVIKEWDHERQTPVLRDRMQELNLIRQRVAPDLVLLTDSYRAVIDTFLRDRDKVSMLFLFRKQVAFRRASDEAVKELNILDTQRLSLRTKPLPLAAKNRGGI